VFVNQAAEIKKSIEETTFTDAHTKTFKIKINELVTMDRALCDADPNQDCSKGLHVASYSYMRSSFGNTTIAVLVNPADVVAVPYDYNFAKMRVCEYKVLNEIDPVKIPEVLDMWLYYDEE
jgi:hypothetical protein